MRSFIAECRRRRVFRVAALYIVGAWVVLQVADLAFEAWEMPPAFLRGVWIAAIFGFPAALIFGWRFDIEGGRIVRTPDADAPADLSLKRRDYVILATLSAVVFAIVFSISTDLSTVAVSPQAQTVTLEADQRSIAVLPFKDVGPDEQDTGFLAVGIQDDVLTSLSKIAAIRVISRTSVERYRDTEKSIPQIGAELGVSKVLEGGVQRLGDEIRINVQLIDAVTDTHLWAETYHRRLTAGNVFSIQSEIVAEIVRQLKATLTPREETELAAMPTDSISAYTAYLRGREQSDIESVQSLNRALEYYEEAIREDPGFALAYVGLADAYLTLGANFRGGLTVDESKVLAEPPLTRALQLNGQLGQAYATLGFLRQQQGNWQAAEEAYQSALSLQPSYARAYRLYGRLRQDQQRDDEAMELFGQALTLDPYSPVVNFDLARANDLAGRFEEALQGYLRVVEIEPDHAFAYVYIAAIHYLVHGRVDESLAWYQKAADNDAMSPSLQAAQALAYLELGDIESARVWVEAGLQLGPEVFWPRWGSLLLNTYEGDEAAVQRDARILLEDNPRNWGALRALRDLDLAAGRLDVARSRYARAYRELLEPKVPDVHVNNYVAAVDLVVVLQDLGETARADDLMERSLDVLNQVPRLGTDGYWVADAQIYCLQRRPAQALNALEQAIDEGWRFTAWYYLERDPSFASIRRDPRFLRLQQIVREDLDAQGERVADMKASGELAAPGF